MSNQSKTALITGASSGFGVEFAGFFAKDGHDLVLVARNESVMLQQAAALSAKYGVKVKVLPKDLSRPEAPQEIFDQLHADNITVDILVNNAGYATYGNFVELNLNGELDMMQVNMQALTHLTRLFLPGMVARRFGKILNIASTAAFQPGPLMAVYYATKAFVLSFSEALYNELSGTGVTVTVLCPGPSQTGFQKRAAMEKSKLVSGKKIMDATTVARIGYDALNKGKMTVIPGFRNTFMIQIVRFTPRKMVLGIVRNMQERTH
ncbi:MAG: SDR family oxidoreductase [Chloroflexi bacterium]|uniref:SDR family oxidoreductase n=1 Tax=Candidatus Chlorohelix allophototropha TaxID=3003348 RepID=A0A8T7M188_9CHLR|nr:SDR family oxidoreductase [Chloroflexota bacterium]WJW66308.1 SDR family oxidoreductase [Chloroflexota bacterium L227-S17]